MSKSELDRILKVSDESNGKYEDGKISIFFKDDKVATVSLQLSYNNEEVKNSNTDLLKAYNMVM